MLLSSTQRFSRISLRRNRKALQLKHHGYLEIEGGFSQSQPWREKSWSKRFFLTIGEWLTYQLPVSS